ncbi:oxidoreductase [Xylona heveae TC161]|uniref:Oxidoreductase n=1 Tax=Xylona heveae (strain CBS 132557 / TC161) TaxID=1328760 RepID=A0A165HQQ7_XYLHT|nr:oxidoreductase [Xylona heveae TC161]KZF23842.1 oxidoreductase [Xylona heveae TC161]
MSSNKLVEHNVAGIDMSGLYPAPFPDDVPIIELKTISLAKLLEKDQTETQRMFEICQDPGFFYLDLTDHPEGLQMLRDVVSCCRLGQSIFPNKSMEEKKSFKTRERIGVFDMGYFTKDVLPDGEPRYSETINIPMTEMFSPPSEHEKNFRLPPWLAPHVDLFRTTMSQGNRLANVIFSVLEDALQLKTGTITSAHQLADPSSDFLRLLRYTGVKPGKTVDQLTFPAHKDAISLAILFTWLGGLQIPAPDATWIGPEKVTEDSWRWVKPIPGTAIVNLGDAIEILTNKVLKSGLHRVVRAPGKQAPFDKYSVLIGTRPNNQLPMVPFTDSPLIPEQTEEQRNAPVLTSEEWGTSKILGLERLLKKRDEDKEVLTFKH